MSDKCIFLETMFDDFTPDSVSREELISILLDDLMVVARDNLSINETDLSHKTAYSLFEM